MKALAFGCFLSLFLTYQDPKLPVPPAADLKKADADLRELFKADLGRTDRESRRALAKRLLTEAGDGANSASSRYAAYTLCKDLAMSALDVTTSFAAIEKLDAQFELVKPPLTGATFNSNANATKALALNGAQKAVVSGSDSLSLGEGYLLIAQKALLERNFDDALSAAKLADKYGKTANSNAIQDKSAQLLREIPDQKKEDDQVSKLQDKGAAEPSAKLVRGRHLLFVANKEEEALAALVECSDELVKKAARLETSKSPAAEIAEAWLAAADKEPSALQKRRYVMRAIRLFNEAVKSAGGLDKARLEKRIEELGAKGKLLAAWVDVLGSIDPKKDTISGNWERSGARVISTDGKWSKVEIPYEPPDEYDFRVTFETGAATEVMLLGVFRNKPFAVGFFMGQTKALYYHSGSAVETQGLDLPTDRPVSVVLQVRLHSITFIINGKAGVEWSPNPETLFADNFWGPKNPKILGFGHHGPKVSFITAQVAEITGKSRRTR